MSLRSSFALLTLLVTAGGCDSVGTAATEYDGIVEVSLMTASATDLALRLVAIEDQDGCSDLLRTTVRRGSGRRAIVVDGIERPAPGTPVCRAIIPASATIDLEVSPDSPSGLVLEVEHAGATDVYGLDLTAAVPVLEAVRTSTTRLAR